MPKKRNFLGGMQNYNPNTGEYEPALKGPNGESPSGFKSFKKAEDKDESFDTVNEKRMGKVDNTNAEIFNDYKEEYAKAYKENGEKGLKDAVLKSGYTTEQYNYALEQLKGGTNDETESFDADAKESGTKYFRHPEVDGVWHDTGKTTERNGNTYKIFENEEGNTWAVSERFSKQFEEVDMSKEPELLSEEYLDKFYELANGDEDKMTELIRKDKRYQEGNGYGAGEENFSMGDLQGIVESYMMKKTGKGTVDRYKEKFGKSAFEETNNKRMGIDKKVTEWQENNPEGKVLKDKSAEEIKEESNKYKNPNRKDKYGNPLISDKAFKIAQKGLKDYLALMTKYNSLDNLKKSNVFLRGLHDVIDEKLEEEGLNPNFDITYQDLNEIIGSVIGEEVDMEKYETYSGNGWTGRKYTGYQPK